VILDKGVQLEKKVKEAKRVLKVKLALLEHKAQLARMVLKVKLARLA
jgi:hypothetical protein